MHRLMKSSWAPCCTQIRRSLQHRPVGSHRSCRRGLQTAPASLPRLGQPSPLTHPHLLREGDITVGTSAEEYVTRRKRLVEQLPDNSLLILPSHPKKIMTHDIPFAFRQESNFHYLTGLEEPDCLLCITKDGVFHLFVQEKSEEFELWNGPRTGTDGAISFFGCDAAHTVDAVESFLSAKLGKRDGEMVVYYMSGVNPAMDDRIVKLFGHVGLRSYTTAGPLMQRIRRYKSEADIAMFQRAADISKCCFEQAFRATRPGLSEHHIFNVMEFEARLHGAQRLAYPPVIAGGANGLSLHYVKNSQVLRDGDLLLVDAGAEYHHYTSDVTRTWPVNGKFSAAQKRVYEAVLDCNQQIIAAHAGGPHSGMAIQSLSAKLLTERLVDFGVLKGTVQSNLAGRAYAKYYPHAIGHPMGWDIHEEDTNSLGPNMIVTVEPGLYLPVDDEAVPAEFRGIAIRIEDNIVLTDGEPRVLTREIPKTVDDIEKVMGERASDPLSDYVATRFGF